ncbi:protein kinase domain-containing protein [Bradyrhizobium jicamae]|uniref:serine/threonine-protein kinase n=1 Tax=Bradyrhizobium jicamae TaxID=280332 RepID=UPI002898BA00|nr:protein kinase [Bradyrhizobium jicamae]
MPSGTRLNGIYEIDRIIGAGGMGEVYKGHEVQTGTAVAIKMLVPDMAENEAALALFRREAAALHYLMHDAIVRYFVFTVEPILQRPYLAMEYVDGRSLADLLEEGPLTLEALLRLTKRVASGLKAAHERGIIHRDVSPDNIIIPQNDVARAKIIDFGIARSTQLGDATIIGSGFAGKHNYVSPEQIGLYGGEVNAQSDVYSLGLVLFFALTGTKLDMGGTQFQLVEKRRRVPDLGAIDSRIRRLFERMLQPDPKDRPTMAEVESWNIGSFLTERAQPIIAPPTRSTEPRPSRTWIRYAIAASALLVIGVGSFAYYSYVWNAPIDLPERPVATLNPNQPTLQPSDTGSRPTDSSKDTSAKPLEPPAPPLKPNQATLQPSDTGSRPTDSSKDTSAKPPLGNANRVELTRRYLQQYDGGDCFFIMPMAIGTSGADLEGFGSSTAPFEALDKSFKRSQGYEAMIGVRLVTSAQCPAITFLNKVRGDASRAPRISLSSVKIRPDETITGNIENFANRVVELLLISEDGQVQNLSYLLRPGTDTLSFSIEMKRSEEGLAPSVPLLIMAVATPRVLDSLRQPRPTPADLFFLQVLSEAQRANMMINASARYLSIQK